MVVTHTDVYWDPYDVEINTDPYPVFKRLREEAPLYYNEQYDFYAVSRFPDVERGCAIATRSSRAAAGCSRSSSPAWRCRRAS